MSDEVACLRCPECSEPVVELSTGGYIHDYSAIGYKALFLHPDVVNDRENLLRTLVCSRPLMTTGISGTYDNLGGHDIETYNGPLNRVQVYKVVNAAMVAAFQTELEENPGLDWSDVRPTTPVDVRALLLYLGNRKGDDDD